MRTIGNILAQISRFCARKGDIHEFGTKSGHIPRPPPLTFAHGGNIIFVYFLCLPARNIKMPVRFARLCLLLLCKSKKTYETIAVRKTSRVEKQHLFAECDATQQLLSAGGARHSNNARLRSAAAATRRRVISTKPPRLSVAAAHGEIYQ